MAWNNEYLPLTAAWLLGIITSPLSKLVTVWWLGPKLSLDHDTEQVPPSNPNSADGKSYVHVKIQNVRRRIARNCRGYLAGIEERDAATGAFRPIFPDSVPLLWSQYAQVETCDIPKNVPICVDVAIVPETGGIDPQIWSPTEPPLRPLQLTRFLDKPGIYRFKVLVSADEIPPESIVLEVKCDKGERVQVTAVKCADHRWWTGWCGVFRMRAASPGGTDDKSHPAGATHSG